MRIIPPSFKLGLAASASFLLCPFSLLLAQELYQPISVSSSTSGSDFFPVDNLIDGSGLTLIPVDGTNFENVTHPSSNSTNAWVTTGFSPTYYGGGGPAPFLTFDLGDTRLMASLVIWGYPLSPGNEAQSFSLRFSDDNDFSSVTGSTTVTAAAPTGEDALTLPFDAAYSGQYVEITITDNHSEQDVGGDRVGLGEVRFLEPFVEVTTLNDNGGGSLRQALIDTPEGGRIIFASNLNGGIISLESELVIDKSLTIDASALDEGIIIDGAEESRCVLVSNGDVLNRLSVTLNKLTLQNGSVENDGGNLRNVRENLVLNDCRILNGQTIGNPFDGGGIHSFDGNLTLNRCTLSGNRTEGTNADGGAIYFQNGNLTLDSCTVVHNSTSGNFADGGGIFSSISRSDQKAQLLYCTLAHNQAPNAAGGGFFNEQGPTEFIHCTITQNLADTDEGSGFANASDANITITTNTFRNTLMVGNHDSDIDFVGSALNAAIDSDGGNTIGTGNAVGGFNNATDNTGETEAFLSPLGDYGGPTQTMHPLSGLPLVPQIPSRTTDQRGFDFSLLPNVGAVSSGGVFNVNIIEDPAGIPVGILDALSLRQALALSNASARTIRFSRRLNGETITLNPSLGELLIARDIFIDASALGSGLTINAGEQSRCILVDDGNSETEISVALQNITLTRGASSAEGGGLSNVGEVVTLNSCRVIDNCSASGTNNPSQDSSIAGSDGGGIYSRRGALALNFSEVSDNTTGIGGDGSQGGSGGNGGGIAVFDGALTLNASLVSGNRTGGGGAGGSFTSNGSEGFGGGIYSLSATVTLANSTISGNATDLGSGNTLVIRSRGGGIYSANSALTLISSTISQNLHRARDGAGITLLSPSADPIIQHSIVAGNGESLERFVQLVHSASVTPIELENLIGGEPRLAPLANYGGPTATMPPYEISPAIDAASSSRALTDQRGLLRSDSAVDIGAVETFPTDAPLLNFLLFQTDFDGDGNPYGLEIILGTDPEVADAGDARNLTATTIDAAGNVSLTFSNENDFFAAAPPFTTFYLTRSTTLDPQDFERILRVSNDGNGNITIGDIEEGTFQQSPTVNTFIDNSSPEPKAFYRLEVFAE